MKKFITSAILAFAMIATVHSQIIADFAGGDDLAVGPGTAGYEFTPNTGVTLQTLGIWGSSEALFNPHAVGLWDATSQTLLRTVVVHPSTAVKIGEFWYANIAPITLASGTKYVLGASYADNDFDFARGNVTSVTTSFTIGDPLLSSGSGFEFPGIRVTGAELGFFGPNAGFAPVPEPEKGALAAGLILAGLAVARRLRTSALPLLAAVTLTASAAEPPVTIRAVLDAKPADRKRLLKLMAKQRPVTAKTVAPVTDPTPAENRPPLTPGNEHGNRPEVPPGLKNYATP